MSYATDDAEMFSAREILYLCRGKLLGQERGQVHFRRGGRWAGRTPAKRWVLASTVALKASYP